MGGTHLEIIVGRMECECNVDVSVLGAQQGSRREFIIAKVTKIDKKRFGGPGQYACTDLVFKEKVIPGGK